MTHRRSSGPSLTDGCVVRPAQPVLRPPPTPTRHATHFPGSPVIGHVAPTTTHRRPPGRGGPPQFPPPPSERSAPLTPESPSRLHTRLYTASMAFTLIPGARHSLRPPTRGGPLTTPQASRNATDRSVAPPDRAFDAGLRRRTFPSDTASLLPGLLAATRTGLPPAGDDELVNSKITYPQ
jgi:hypothetical protein